MTDDFREIENIFKKRDMNQYYQYIENAKRQSIKQNRVPKKAKKVTVLENMLFRKIPITICGILITGMIAYLMYNTTIKPFTDSLAMSNMSKSIGGLVNQDKENDPLYKRDMTIVAQNTYVVGGQSAYDHDKIAKDIIDLDDPRLFDYTLCCVYSDMGENVNNSITNHSLVTKSNIDWVISSLKLRCSLKSTEIERYIADSLDGINSMDEYLIRNGYVDKNMQPDFDAFKTAMEAETETIANLLNVEKGVHKNGI